jgi:hypothetical protein
MSIARPDPVTTPAALSLQRAALLASARRRASRARQAALRLAWARLRRFTRHLLAAPHGTPSLTHPKAC